MSLLSQSLENFRRCDGKMGVPITFLSRAVRERGTFYNRHHAKVNGAVFSLANSTDGSLHYYEILGSLSSGKIGKRNMYKRIIIWEVYK